MSKPSLRRASALAAATMAAALVAAAPAGAVDGVPDGIWGPFDRCPLDDPLMNNPSGTDVSAICVASTTEPNAGGKFRIGSTTTELTAPTDLQFGVVVTADGELVTVSQPGALRGGPNTIPGGLLGTLGAQAVADLLAAVPGVAQLTDAVNKVTATVEQAGDVADFDLLGALTGTPVLTLPVKIHLQNLLLGPSCYIGSDENPIVLRPQSGLTSPPPPNEPISGDPGELSFVEDPDAPPEHGMGVIGTTGGTLVDNSFAVPAASGCGPLGLADGVINDKLGLPSPAGRNEIVLAGSSALLGGAVNTPERNAADALRAEIAEG